MFDDGFSPVSADAALEELRSRIGSGRLESWLTSTSGRLLAVTTNTERAMVVLLDGEGDSGGHAADPEADGLSNGFVLANGQHDEYPDEDTVPVTEALRVVHHIITKGVPPADVAWRVDG